MYSIGIDLGGTNIAAGLVDDQYHIIEKMSIPTHSERSAEEIIDDMAKLSMKLADATVGRDQIGWIGIGIPGSVSKADGVVLHCVNVPFEMSPVRERIQKLWNVPVYIDNDANAAALGEVYAGAAAGCDNSITVTLGTGVGGGIIIDKKIYAGFNDNGAEVGHMVIHKGGVQCNCGRCGCWETYASVNALIRQTKVAMAEHPESMMWEGLDRNNPHVSGKTSFVAAKKGDAAALKVVEKYFEYVAEGMTNLINIFQPEVLCIGGAISKEGDYLLNPVKKLIERDRFTRYCSQTEIRICKLGNDAGIIGAAVLGRQYIS